MFRADVPYYGSWEDWLVWDPVNDSFFTALGR